ncbi:Thioredoxin-like superfamily [Sesbania bispinosa]|nr:Thioredoxin-like superfamily [Sesbania bispinosa]
MIRNRSNGSRELPLMASLSPVLQRLRSGKLGKKKGFGFWNKKHFPGVSSVGYVFRIQIVVPRCIHMATSFSNIVLKGIATRSLGRPLIVISFCNGIIPLTCWQLNGSFYHYRMRYSTTVSTDSDTHDDFKPTNKLDSPGMSLTNIVDQDVKDNPVMIYMKGVPDFPQCGFSALAVRV